MSYVVLARKWRPMRFEDLVGQDHVAKTLGNAIDAGRVAHAFLFTGVRGVGKTTSARILAKALNCMREPGTLPEGAPDPGPTVTPCLKCSACLEITDGRDLDVQEIDGASYNGVDEVRKLQDSLPYRPSRDRYKVIIVDEVHMLSQAAWNAFLKTLEEPPPHVKFIFATTEVHKVPITILSRVQRFDFKMIPTRLIVERLRWVLSQENSSADEGALTILARQAAGSMRDAMSLLDQVIAFTGETLSADEVARVLGVASRGALVDIARAVVGGDPQKCLAVVGSLADQGFDIPHVTRDVLSLLRDLVVAKVCKEPGELLDLADEERGEVLTIASSASESDLLRLYQGFSRGYDEVVRSSDPRAGLEMLLVRLSLRPPLLAIDELLHRISHLEKRLIASGATASHPRPHAATPNQGRVPESPVTARPRERASQDKPTSAGQPASGEDDGPGAQSVRPEPTSKDEKAVESLTPPPRISEDEKARLDFLCELIDRVRTSDKEIAAFLEQTVPLSVSDQLVEIGLEKGHIFEKQITAQATQDLLRKALDDARGPHVKLKVTVASPDATPDRTASAERVRQRRAREILAIEEVKNHPRVREAVEIFRAEIKNVHIPDLN